MGGLGSGLNAADKCLEALSVYEAELAMKRHLGQPEGAMLIVQGNIALIYHKLGRNEESLHVRRDVYFGFLKLEGEEHRDTILASMNYAASLHCLGRFKEAKSWLRKHIPLARRVLGDSHECTLKMRSLCALALYRDPGASLDDLRESVTTFKDTVRIAHRVFGRTHPVVGMMEGDLRAARAALRARETPPGTTG